MITNKKFSQNNSTVQWVRNNFDLSISYTCVHFNLIEIFLGISYNVILLACITIFDTNTNYSYSWTEIPYREPLFGSHWLSDMPYAKESWIIVNSPIIIPIRQWGSLCEQDIRVPVASLRMPITVKERSWKVSQSFSFHFWILIILKEFTQIIVSH